MSPVRRSFTLLLILVVALTFSLVSQPVHAQDFTVNTLDHHLDFTCDVSDCSLADAIYEAGINGTADTITFSVSGTIELTSALPNLPNDAALTIDGGGAITISRNSFSEFRIFTLSNNADVTLTGLTITNGSESQGGGVYLTGGTLTITNSTFSGNNATAAGGAIYKNGSGSLTITNVTFSGNSTGGNGGAIFALSNSSSDTMTITGSTFDGNSASIGGGAINLNSALTVNITGSTFTNNSSDAFGGAIFDADGALTVTSSTFVNNHAILGGGAIFYFTNNGTVINSTFSGNTGLNGGSIYAAGQMSIYDSTLSEGSASGSGGNLYNEASLTLYNSIVANASSGGDCVNAGYSFTVQYTLIEDGSCGVGTGPSYSNGNLSGDPNLGAFTGVYYPLNAGSIAIDAGSDSLIPVGVTTDQIGSARSQNTAVDMGAIETIYVTPTVTISPTSASVAEGDNTNFTITRAGDTSSALVVTVNITPGTDTTGGDYTLSGGSISGQSGTVTVTIPISSASVDVNFAATDDAAAEPDNTLTLDLVDGADYDLGADTQAVATIPRNDLGVTNFDDDGEGSLRQAVTNANTFPTDDTITFTVNGTITLSSATLTIDDATTAGELTIDGSGQTVTIGGGITRLFTVNSGGDLTVQNLTIAGSGGGILAFGDALTVTNVIFNGSTSIGVGGGIYNLSGTMTVTGSSFINGSAVAGGGIHNQEGTVTVRNSSFSGNSANFGGGISNADGTMTIINSTFSGNSAQYGGAIRNAGVMYIYDSTLSDGIGYNFAANLGNQGTLTLYNSIVANGVLSADCVSDGSIDVQYTLIEDGSCGISNGVNSNLTGDPGLSSFTGSYYPPASSTSIIVDAGSNSLIPGGVTTDQVGNARIQGNAVDMGAYESSFVALPLVTINPSSANINEGGNTDFTIARTGSTGSALVVTLSLIQSGTSGSDYTFSGASITGQSGTQTITIPAGQSSVNLNFAAAADNVGAEQSESVVLMLSDQAEYDVGSPSSAIATITQNDFVVTNLNDSGEGSLRQAITNANVFNTDDTITFTVSGTIQLASNLPDLANNGALTINGGGAITLTPVSSTNYRAFTLASGANVTLTNMNITAGLNTYYNQGGLIHMDSGTLTVTNSSFYEGSADNGGAIYNNAGTVNIVGSFFYNNGAPNGGSIYNWSGQVTVTSSTFDSNVTTVGLFGGGIHNAGGTVTVINSTIRNLGGANHGAGIYNTGTLYVYDSTFAANRPPAGSYAADIYNSGTAIVYNSILADQQRGVNCINAGTITIQNTLIEDGSCGITNGVNGNKTGDPNLGTFTGTYYPLNTGSAAIDAGNNSLIPGGVTTDQAGNARAQNGVVDMGAIESTPALPTVTLTGGATISEGGTTTFTLTRSIVTSDPLTVNLTLTPNGLSGGDYTFTDPSNNTITTSAVIPANEASVILTFAAVSDGNSAEPVESLGVALAAGSYTIGSPSSGTATINQNGLVVTNANDSGDGSLRLAVENAHAAGGGTVDLTAFTGTITLNSTITISSSITLDGSGTGALTISANGFRAFTVTGGSVLLRSFTISGGGVEASGGNLTIGNSPVIITGNNTTVCGGGLLVNGGAVTLQAGSQITGNTTSDNGGGICVTAGSLTVTGGGTQVNGNTATLDGGGIYVSGGTVTVESGAAVNGNTATNGGGIYQAGGDLSVTGSRVEQNTSTASSGSAIRFAASGTRSVTNTCIVGNNDTAVTFAGGSDVVATGNWWGSPFGPFSGLDTPAPNDANTLVSTGDQAQQSFDPNIFDYSGYITTPVSGCFACATPSGVGGGDRNNRMCSLVTP